MTIAPIEIGSVTIRPVLSPGDLEMFLDVSKRVYANDPNWVQPLRSSIAKHFKPDAPFLQYGKLQAFIATRMGKNGTEAVGRVVASVNQRLIDKEGQQVGLFGFFECIEDFSVAEGLFNAACDWLRRQGMTVVRGPIDLSTHINCLFLVDGFDSGPMIMMPYNPPYYPQFVERAGWQKAKDAYSYVIHLEQELPPEYKKGYDIAIKSGITFRPIHTKGEEFQKDVESLYHLFTKAFSDNYSSTPRSLEEFVEEAQDLQQLVDPDVFPVAEYNGEMVGFWMGLPDYNIALKHVNGKLNWLGILKFLWYRRQIDQGRVLVICSLPEYRRKLVPLGLIYLGMLGGIKKGKPYKRAELGFVYEDNMPSRKLVESAGGKICKTYRIYEKPL
ncbi:hypothetical protein ACQ4M4_00005 [Leptolyngbya sp. AN02str]|uniref:hypothetical protein n=1 Tax=Leptolyngbya sp. AN02str TaxID=3423363 RepID=UPI003D317B56